MTRQNPDIDVNGLIFAGGKSSRMGHDKGLIVYHHKPQREHLFDILSTLCQEVYTSCKNNTDVPAFLHPLADAFTVESPLNGLLTAFELRPAAAWLTVPVDMPNLNQSVLSFLLQHRDRTKLATCFYDSDGRDPEPLVAVWESAAYPLLKEHMRKGHRGIKPFMLQHDICILTSPDVRMHDNINSPEAMQAFIANRSEKKIDER